MVGSILMHSIQLFHPTHLDILQTKPSWLLSEKLIFSQIKYLCFHRTNYRLGYIHQICIGIAPHHNYHWRLRRYLANIFQWAHLQSSSRINIIVSLIQRIILWKKCLKYIFTWVISTISGSIAFGCFIYTRTISTSKFALITLKWYAFTYRFVATISTIANTIASLANADTFTILTLPRKYRIAAGFLTYNTMKRQKKRKKFDIKHKLSCGWLNEPLFFGIFVFWLR